MKRYLFVISKAPYASSHALEQLEAAMVAAVFDGQVSILLRGDGVWGLQKNQEGDAIEQRTFAKTLAALPSYEIERLHACSASISERGVDIDCTLHFESIDYTSQQALLNANDIVIGGQ